MFEFVVRVPEITPPWRPVFLAGDRPALGGWSANAVRLERHDDGTHRTRLDLPADFRGRFLVTLGRWRDAESDGRGHELPTRELHAEASPIEIEVAGWGRGSVYYHHDFPSRFVPHPRTLAVWVPPTYDLDSSRDFPVLYLQDGQNLFDPETAFAGNPWWADEVAEREIRCGRVRPLILVGVANSADRLREYGPRGPRSQGAAEDWSRDYARFLVEEVKPFIDASYRTLRDPPNTGVGGSSMGGLISLHLCKWYPEVFGRCAAMSPSLWWDREHFLRSLGESPRWMASCRMWLDMGTREGASEPAMEAMVRRARRLARLLARHGMRKDEQLHFEKVEGGLHNEAAWGGRIDRVLRFLFPAELAADERR